MEKERLKSPRSRADDQSVLSMAAKKKKNDVLNCLVLAYRV